MKTKKILHSSVISSRLRRYGKLTLGLALVANSVINASAAPAITNYTAGDLLIGFRLPGDSDNLVVNIGPSRNYVQSTTSSSGLWNGALKQIQFGIVPAGEPNAGTSVSSLSAALTQAFGSGWATNDAVDPSSDVSWGVAGTTSSTNNETLNGFQGNTNFVTKAETTRGVVTTIPTNTSSTLNSNVNAQIAGIGSGFNLKDSTLSSSTARVYSTAEANSWDANIGTPGLSSFNGAWIAEQDLSGGPTNSILDLLLDPKTGSPRTQTPNINQYIGSFLLTSDGILYYGSAAAVAAIPEPGTIILLGLGSLLFAYRVYRKRSSIQSHSL